MDSVRRFPVDNLSPIAWKNSDIMDALGPTIHSEINFTGFFKGISTDSRTIGTDELFVALNGDNFDGHDFIPDLLERGIKGFVVSKAYLDGISGQKKKSFSRRQTSLFSVDNTLTALGGLARHQRIRSGVKVVAITGSNGKTTTRQMTASIFRQQYNTLATQGNLNNEIGLPLTLLGLSKAHEWAVVELGMNHPGEISRLSRIAMPDIGIITNIGNAHLEGLGSLENIATAKSEILDGMNQNGMIAINRNTPHRDLIARSAKNKKLASIIFFGTGKNTRITADEIKVNDERLSFNLIKGNRIVEKIDIKSPAAFMVTNALAASTAALYAGLTGESIRKGLADFIPVSGRMRIIKDIPGVTIIDDTYNANPASVKAALETMAELGRGSKNRVAVLGDMLELGTASETLHFEIGKTVAKTRASMLYAHGSMAEIMINGAVEGGLPKPRTLSGTKEKIAAHLLSHMGADAWILVKGSRGMRMETIIHHLQEHLQ